MGFTFKQFHIVDNHTAMKVGTDGVLLGAWAQGGKKILDIGTGTGLIALMMAQRFPLADIDAIEIDKGAFEDAQLNVSQSPFNDRINIINCCLQDYQLCHETCTEGVYDAIVCNPPYFINSLKILYSQERLQGMLTPSLHKNLFIMLRGSLKQRERSPLSFPTTTKIYLKQKLYLTDYQY